MYGEQEARRPTANPNLPGLATMIGLNSWNHDFVVVVAGESQKQCRPDLAGECFADPTSTSASIKAGPYIGNYKDLSSFNGVCSTSFLVAHLVLD